MSSYTERVGTRDIDTIKAKLEELSAALQLRLKTTRDESRPVSLDEPVGRLSRMDLLARQKMSEANRAQVNVRLQRVKAALARLSSGSYGQCLRCDEAIEDARLLAQPEAPLCRSCQSGVE